MFLCFSGQCNGYCIEYALLKFMGHLLGAIVPSKKGMAQHNSMAIAAHLALTSSRRV
jgi:hypothetical protein